LDVELHLAPQVALDDVVAIDHFADLQHFLVGQLRHAPLLRNVDLLHDLGRLLGADAMDVLQRDHDALVGRDVHTGDAGHDAAPVAGAAGAKKSFNVNRFGCAINARTTPTPRPGARHRA